MLNSAPSMPLIYFMQLENVEIHVVYCVHTCMSLLVRMDLQSSRHNNCRELLLENDDQYYACHVVCYIYIAETFSPGTQEV